MYAKSMFTSKEKEGINLILKKLNDKDLISLATTTTKGLIKAENRGDAIQTIVTYTEKSSLLLRRKKVKKEFIFQYLTDEGVVVLVNSDKADCIRTCLKYWQSAENGQELSLAESLDGEDSIMEDLEDYTSSSSSTDVISTTQVEDEKLRCMGQMFATWFYKLVNQGTTGPEHFWPDAELRLHAEDPVQSKFGLFQNAGEVCRFLCSLVCDHRILFDANILGSKSNSNTYGLVTVEISGTLHRNQMCIGLFDNVFGLVKDPQQEDDRWKIKFINLRMKINCPLIDQLLLLHQLKSI